MLSDTWPLHCSCIVGLFPSPPCALQGRRWALLRAIHPPGLQSGQRGSGGLARLARGTSDDRFAFLVTRNSSATVFVVIFVKKNFPKDAMYLRVWPGLKAAGHGAWPGEQRPPRHAGDGHDSRLRAPPLRPTDSGGCVERMRMKILNPNTRQRMT